MTSMRSRPEKERIDVREACVEEALRIIGEQGIESLSLREVARRLGVSHQAPYKHFPGRDHILAEVIGRAFDDFAQTLNRAVDSLDPQEHLAAVGTAYLEYAARCPLQYHLMFGSPLPNLNQHPELAAKAAVAFKIVKDAVRASKPGADERILMQEALFAWATVHGLASITQTGSFSALGIHDPGMMEEASRYAMGNICRVINGSHPRFRR